MKRWVWLGLVVGLVACDEVEQQDCTDTSVSDSALPKVGFSSRASSLEAEEPASLDGRQPVLIRYRRTLSAASATQAAVDAVQRTGGKVTTRWNRLSAVAARVTPEERAKLARDPNVLSIEPDRPVRAFTRQAAPILSGSASEYTEGLKMVQAPAVWDADGDGNLDASAPIGTNIKVCVIDSGWDNRHPELQAAYGGGRDFVEDDDEPLDYDSGTQQWGGGHGTHTAATIAAQLGSLGTVNPHEDSNGVVGVAPGVELLVARVLNVRGNGNTADIISALEWCREKGAKIASLSLGAPDASATEEAAFEEALANGLLAIAATGNSGEDPNVTGVAYPAGYPSVVAVGAVDVQKKHGSFSQRGPEVSLVAPGVDVLSAVIVGAEAYSLVETDGREFESNSLAFAPAGSYKGKLLTCGIGDSRSACGQEATCKGFVAYVDRGGVDAEGNGLTFAKKVDFMRRAGARAVIIGNNDPDDGVGSFTLGTAGEWVPTASVSFADGSALKAMAGKSTEVKLSGVDYVRLTGTSMATPHVAGVAALVWSARPSLTPPQVRKLLEDSAEDLGTPGRDELHGFGLVRAKNALEALGSLPTTP
ncbi:S8 family serine peptidase [Hyalangium rubrum]|uniref:S8 family serine peptidase n=1 Tax=Hyalangium rubrum TaxID=3103134 RepID=A0ABU5HAH4_9BACT|nr:S8 family serine peptidase [Hyalangium sp. s54d21]MDY7230310.1 S8 family serine peptidase [Hyalangium sp. s54d21]